MTAAAVHAARGDAATPGAIDAGLAIAARAHGFTFIAVPAPVVGAPALLDAYPTAASEPRVAWTAGELSLVGFGAASELRASGEGRWADLARAAQRVAIAGAVIDGAPTAVGALAGAQPRWIGGAAFAPGAADRAPWTGFGDAWFVLPRWTYVREGDRARLVLAVDARDAVFAARWRDELTRLHAALVTASAGLAARPQPALVELQRASADEWRQQIIAITDAIAAGTCSKIVAARTAVIALAGAVRAPDLLAALDHRHAECVRVAIQPAHAGALVAATPERLVRRDGDLVLVDALAGTRSIGAAGGDDASTHEQSIGEASAALLASQKDLREHALVVDAIRAALEGDAEVAAPSEPAARVHRHLVHLYTPFRARLRTPRHVLELAARLHPTPAMGGTPRETAIDWIRSREPAQRGWYSAPVGWFDLDGNGEFAVAIRAGVVAGNRAHLWAGAGIVAGSDPDRELAETEVKFRVMLGALGVTAEPPAAPAEGGG
jgi:isochorismate synthase